MKRRASKAVHLISGGTIGEIHSACGLRVASESEAAECMSINPEKVTCVACRQSEYFEKMAPTFAHPRAAERGRRGHR